MSFTCRSLIVRSGYEMFDGLENSESDSEIWKFAPRAGLQPETEGAKSKPQRVTMCLQRSIQIQYETYTA
jgi:hypothetical protein